MNLYMKHREKLPKLILYATHQETLAPLLGAFENNLLTDPAAASSVFFWFFRYKNEGDSTMHSAVKVSFSETPWDKDSH